MFSDKSFPIALTISLIVHTTIFFKWHHINLLRSRRDLDKVELTYLREKAQLPSLKLYDEVLSKESSRQKSNIRVAPPPHVKKEQIFKKVKNIPISKPEFLNTEIIALKKKVTIPPLSDEKITNPVYLNYYQIIREKIREAAYQNYTRLVNGDVYLSFIILNNGQLKDIRINEEKSSTHIYLKDIAKKSIYDASPFSSFPKELNYPELSFNVIITFEVE